MASGARLARSFLAVLLFLPTPIAAALAAVDSGSFERGGEFAYRQALKPAAEAKRMNDNPATVARVRRVMARLLAVAPAIEPSARNLSWAVNVVSVDDADVFVYPGGRFLVHDALVDKSGLTDDELSAILAHATAHVLLGHDSARIDASAASIAASPDPNREMLAVAAATAKAVRGRYSTAALEAADRTALVLMARAAYDPRAAGSAWRRLARAGRGYVERAPVNEARLAAIDASVRAVMPMFEAARASVEAQSQAPMPAITGPAGKPVR
ncbi:MAG TPA: M48 family metalloprotease [Casimicrobiaceae bacterium]|nr:M48 family metalloprotease [Casimicrobiaceae bacterium]